MLKKNKPTKMNMKHLLLTSAMVFSMMAVSAQPEPVPVPAQPNQLTPVPAAATKNPEFVQFKEITYDFGNIKQGVPASHTFTFKNVGTRDITLENVSASCGCTTPNWKGGAYKPQENGDITATYNAAGEGSFQKSITVTTSEGVIVLTISGTVLNETAYNEWKAKKDAEDAAKAKQDASNKKPASKKSSKSKAPKSKAKSSTQGTSSAVERRSAKKAA